ncbi:MAG: T9SS type A sorting domain-containing protein, partial [Bacteroidales bacterium]|nr:T9SS type A sorting domain-containing protein [Bacteroidales bacterium]MCF8459025.1 T9SS type A sorting domain-containing protein [Bacteroidales bacterium]
YYTTYNTGNNSLGSNTIYRIKENPVTHNLWFSGYDGLMMYDSTGFTSDQNPFNALGIGKINFDFDTSGTLWYQNNDTLFEYDGTNLSYFLMPNSPQGTFDVLCDSQGNIWLGTSNGLVRFDGSNFSIYNQSTGLPGNFISCLFEDNQGNVWIGANMGAVVYDGTNWTTYNAAQGLQWSNNTSGVQFITQDQSGTIWAGGREIAYFSGNTWTVLSPSQITNSTDTIIGITSIVNDSINQRLWFGTDHSGIFYREGNNWYRHSINEGLPSNRVLCGFLDSQNRVWFGLRSEGLVMYQNATWSYTNTYSGLVENEVHDIFESNDNDLFVITVNGLSRYDFQQWEAFHTCYQCNTGYEVKNDFDGHVTLIGDQLYRYQNNAWDTTYYSPSGGAGSSDFISFASDDFWIAFIGAVAHIWGPDFWNYLIFENWTVNEGLPHYACKAIERDSSGVIWAGTFNGMAYLQGNIFIPLTVPSDDFGTRINDIRTDLEGNIWFASNIGVAKYTGSSWEFFFETDGLANNWVEDIEIAEDSTIWFATWGGVSVLNDTTIYSIKEPDGLIDNYVRCIEQDHLGNMWIGTQHGISVLQNAVPVLSKKEIKQQTQLTIYPNPSKNNITISSFSEIITIEFYSPTGQLLRKINSHKMRETVDVSDLPPGNYYIRAIGNKDVWVKKFVVVK